MATERYSSTTGVVYTLPVVVKDKVKYIQIGSGTHEYETNDEDEQSAIKKLPHVLNGKIAVFGNSDTVKEATNDAPKESVNIDKEELEAPAAPTVEEKTNDAPEGVSESANVYPNITTIQRASAILRAEPYKVHRTKVDTPEKVIAVAKELGVSFPNLNA